MLRETLLINGVPANGNTSGLLVNQPIVTNSSLRSVQLQAPEFIQG
jgi:hypothetical protein